MDLRIMIGNHHFVSKRRLEDLVEHEQGLQLIGSAENGNDLYLKILKYNPNLVILNATMPGLDSIHLIEIIRRDSKYDQIKFLLIGTEKQNNIMDLLETKKNVWFVSYEKTNEVILKMIRETAKDRQTVSSFSMPKDMYKQAAPEQLQLIVTKVMHEMGIPAHIKGYMFLRSALMIAVEDMSILNAVTKQLYPEIAKQYKSTPSRVERAIRHAIEIAWERGSQSIMKALFYGIDAGKRDKPTNSEFIALLADKIRLEGNCENWTY